MSSGGSDGCGGLIIPRPGLDPEQRFNGLPAPPAKRSCAAPEAHVAGGLGPAPRRFADHPIGDSLALADDHGSAVFRLPRPGASDGRPGGFQTASSIPPSQLRINLIIG
jgi:hypothetical protein